MSKPEKKVVINTKENPALAFESIMRGVNLLSDAVKSTLGPYGRNFLIEKSGGRITNDGITVARDIEAKDEIEDLAIRVVREAAIKTNEDAGDGTTTATTLAQAILQEAYERMGKKGTFAKESVSSMRKRIQTECAFVVEEMQKLATPRTGVNDLIDAARVSVEDEDLAELIGGTQWELGPKGTIIVEESNDMVCSVERIHGVRIDNGLGTSMVINDPEKQRLTLKNVPVLLTNYQMHSIAPIKNALDALVQSGVRDIVIVASVYSSECIQEFQENFKRGIRLYPLQAPYVNQREVMKDLQSVLGGRYIHNEESSLESATAEDFGLASTVLGYRWNAIFSGTGDITERCETIRKEIEGEPSKFNKKAMETRLSQLENGFALLKIGSTSDIDRKYLYDKAEDAVNTVRSALAEGTVPGAGLVYKIISEKMDADAILKKALLAPYKQIIANGGLTEKDFVVEPWVRNSVKVDRVALINACKIASDLVTVGGAIAKEKIKPIDQLLKSNQENESEKN